MLCEKSILQTKLCLKNPGRRHVLKGDAGIRVWATCRGNLLFLHVIWNVVSFLFSFAQNKPIYTYFSQIKEWVRSSWLYMYAFKNDSPKTLPTLITPSGPGRLPYPNSTLTTQHVRFASRALFQQEHFHSAKCTVSRSYCLLER